VAPLARLAFLLRSGEGLGWMDIIRRWEAPRSWSRAAWMILRTTRRRGRRRRRRRGRARRAFCWAWSHEEQAGLRARLARSLGGSWRLWRASIQARGRVPRHGPDPWRSPDPG